MIIFFIKDLIFLLKYNLFSIEDCNSADSYIFAAIKFKK